MQIGGRIIPKEEKGPFVNVAFTLDLEAHAMLMDHGKNKSLTVRRAIKHYCKEVEPSPALLEKFNEVCIERNELRSIVEMQKEIINRSSITDQKPTLRQKALPGLLLILKRLRDLFYKDREGSTADDVPK